MALDFPANPVQGQQNTLTNGVTYQWDGAKWSSKLVSTYANTGANPGTTPPVNPSPGTFWWDSENGQLYIWYDDVNSSQWMPASVLGTVYDSLGNAVSNSVLSSRNLATGVYDLSLGLEGQASYDGNQILDLPVQLELGQNLEVTSTNQVVTDTDTD